MGEAAGPDEAAAERRFRFELAAHPGSPAQARRLARARLTGWSVCEDTCDTAALVISELVTNAIVHTASDIVVCELSDGDDVVRIAVHDEGCAPGEPHPSPQRPEEEHGRGLLLVEALCHAWGAQEYGSGLLVWADLPRGAATQEHTEAAVVQAEPRDDLGWGARPKPGPADGSRDEDESDEQARRRQRGDGATSRQGDGPVPRQGDGPVPRQGDGPAALAAHQPALADEYGAKAEGAAPTEGPREHAVRPVPDRTPAAPVRTAQPTRPPHHIPAADVAAPRVASPWPHDSAHQGLEHRGSTHPCPEDHVAAHWTPGHLSPSPPDSTHPSPSPTPEQRTAAHWTPGHPSPSHPDSTQPSPSPTPEQRTAAHRTQSHPGVEHRAAVPCAPAHHADEHRTADHCTLGHHGVAHHAADHCALGHHGVAHHAADPFALAHHSTAHQAAPRRVLPPPHSCTAFAEVPAPGLPALERIPERGWV